MFDLKRRIHVFRLAWSKKAPKDKWLFLYNIPRTMFELVGVRVFSDLKVNWYSQLGNLLVLYYGSMTSYTLYYYHCKNQLMYGTRCLCGIGILISVKKI